MGRLKHRVAARKEERIVEISERPKKSAALRLATMTAAVAALGAGIFGIGFGSCWAPAALKLVAGNEFAQNFELAIPFVPISLIALAAFLAVQSRR